MYNITVVCTRHEELGKCNSGELYKIFETLHPDLIFEEIPPSYFDKYYTSKERRNMETDTITRFCDLYHIEHVPVDSDNFPPESFFRDYEALHKRIEGLGDVNSYHYKYFTDTYTMNIESHGFRYLNSIYSENANAGIADALENGLKVINDEKLNQTYALWKNINEQRENEMLQNIYRCCKENSFNKAVFTIGAGHRKSLMKKVQSYKEQDMTDLDWTFFGDL